MKGGENVNSVLPLLNQSNANSLKGITKSSRMSGSIEHSFQDALHAHTINNQEETIEPIANFNEKIEDMVKEFLSESLLPEPEMVDGKNELLDQLFQQPNYSLKELFSSIKSILTSLLDQVPVVHEDMHDKISELLQTMELVNFEQLDDSQEFFMDFLSILSQVDLTNVFLQQQELTNTVKQNNYIQFQQLFKTLKVLVEKFSSNCELFNKVTSEDRIVFEKVLQQLRNILANEAVLKQAYANVENRDQSEVLKFPSVYVPIKNIDQKAVLTSTQTMHLGVGWNQNNESDSFVTTSQLEGDYDTILGNDRVTNVLSNTTAGQKLDSITLLNEQNKPVTYERFVQQFASIINKGKLINNGQLQKLTIQLKPEHLGSLKIELVQQNNEMIARIISTSKTAKELLDSQIQGLRHAFIQQNITVTRIDIETQMYQDDQQRFNHQENTKDQGKQEQKHQQEQGRDKFSDTLQETLVNYEV